jgi:hypothetical protein
MSRLTGVLGKAVRQQHHGEAAVLAGYQEGLHGSSVMGRLPMLAAWKKGCVTAALRDGCGAGSMEEGCGLTTLWGWMGDGGTHG